MRYLKEFKIFENNEISNWSEVKDAIKVLEDEIDFQNTENNFSINSNYIYFIFKSSKMPYSSDIGFTLSESDEKLIDWFINRILDIKFIILDQYVIEVLKYSYNDEEDLDVIQIGKNKVYVSKKSLDRQMEYKYMFQFKVKNISLSEYAIKNNDIDILKSIGPDRATKELFHSYCKDSYHFNFSVFSIFSVKNKLLEPVKKSDIRLRHNLSEQFIIDITPIFLEKVYKNSGLIFRLGISKYDVSSVTREDRLSSKSISDETNEVLEKLGIDLTWEDIFIVVS